MNRNNNPLNIKFADPDDRSILWRGSLGYDSRGHAIFLEAADGIRGGMRSLQRKWHNGKRTVRRLCADWADSGDTIGSIPGAERNNPVAYARYVAKRAGVGIDEVLPEPENSETLATWERIIEAMARYELGEPCPDEVISEGLGRWWDSFVAR